MTKISSGDTYEHEYHGTIRVSCVLDKYEAYESDSQVGHGPQTLVRFGSRWDEYGLQPPIYNQPIDKFVELIEPVE